MIVEWLPKAISTRDAQLDYIAQNNPVAAIEYGDLVAHQVSQLSTYLELGRAGRKQGTCELVISRTSFVVIYRVKAKIKRVEILRVLHGSQQWPL
ncbi:MAG: type II toxin-antitoxin system RelE/ParE family toxin [Methylotenera sp.]|nr:type II toxin-antitoxin system RelE/ParE family toxin [Methylotenera sp.]MDP1597415.1 type II toxin-antitoxin system RelE/ParE family toxin [Methylotenera sp.]MDP1755473.1 type II toxin-antitoxin system RelE/ParE family toxin [Methylotenera sp.]MDP1960310.1 type II toxin-antitoxin system RelE/ParE family toxin [Methylotenera sp.]MDP2402853.1 type II toxin-antitoxin system RelE/ParE family toxin [Methylotenera sp.]